MTGVCLRTSPMNCRAVLSFSSYRAFSLRRYTVGRTPMSRGFPSPVVMATSMTNTSFSLNVKSSSLRQHHGFVTASHKKAGGGMPYGLGRETYMSSLQPAMTRGPSTTYRPLLLVTTPWTPRHPNASPTCVNADAIAELCRAAQRVVGVRHDEPSPRLGCRVAHTDAPGLTMRRATSMA
jgi:hypothetical protein